MIRFNYGYLKEMRRKRRWTQKELARRIGVASSCISRWETGETPISAEMLAMIIWVLKESNIENFFVKEIA